MPEFYFAMGMAIWLGILTSISPCPLATNIAAISYVSKNIKSHKLMLLSALLYTIGRLVTYAVLGSLLVASLLSVPELSFFLQKNMNIILGPLLIVTGLFLLGVFKLNLSGGERLANLREKVKGKGLLGSFLLGVLFALSFCPVSAALFFGSLLPLAVKFNSGFLLPAFFGIGTALPVIAFAGLLAVGLQSVSKWFNVVSKAEVWVRRATGVIFLAVGFYYLAQYLL